MAEKLDDSLAAVVQKLETLDVDRLAKWLRDRLHNRDALVITRDREPAHYLVTRLHPHLSGTAQSALARVAVRMFGEIARSGTWEPEPAAALLRLVDPLVIHTLHQSRAIEALLEIEEKQPLGSDVGFAAVQGLVALGHNATPRYWSRLVKRDPRYAPIAMEAMARTHFTSLQSWLLRILPHPEMEKAFIRVLPFLVEDHGGDVVMSLIVALQAALSKDGKIRISKFAAREELILPAPTADLLQDHLLELLRCVDTMLKGEASGRSIDTTSAAFSHCARIYRRELRRRRDEQDAVDKSLNKQWELYVGLLEHALSRGEFHDIALSELIDSLEDVAADRTIDAVREHMTASRGWFSSDLRQQVVSSLRLTSALRTARQSIKRRHRETGPSETVLSGLLDI